LPGQIRVNQFEPGPGARIKTNKMNIYQLKAIIKGLELTNYPSDKYLIEFYRNLYQDQIKQIADQVQKILDQENKERKSWNEFLAQ
jgi:hypothetical protein